MVSIIPLIPLKLEIMMLKRERKLVVSTPVFYNNMKIEC